MAVAAMALGPPRAECQRSRSHRPRWRRAASAARTAEGDAASSTLGFIRRVAHHLAHVVEMVVEPPSLTEVVQPPRIGLASIALRGRPTHERTQRILRGSHVVVLIQLQMAEREACGLC